VDAARDEADLTLAAAAIGIGLPLLAICRGLQVVNVACGGTLHQHITDAETTVLHRNAHHAAVVEADSRLGALVGPALAACPSMHHQGVDDLGEGLRVVARAADGMVEAIEGIGTGWVVGVQWHPEDTAADDPEQQRIFDGFVAAATVTAGA
jgi:putative glutamine amidotransferase